ncbi:MAG: site-2 protease family protein [Candidatus Paceibacterota bacterium]
MTILIFFAVLFVLILVHELGHFIVAKWTGMRVDEFGIGFPPRLFGYRIGETIYSLNLLPIGGFVRIFGENFSDPELEEEGREKRSFTDKNKWAQAAVLSAGVAMNILLAWALFAGVLMMGVPTVVDEDEASADAQLVIADVLQDSPAAKERIPVGATVRSLAVSGEERTDLSPSRFSAFMSEHSDEEVTITYEASGEIHTATVTPTTGVIPDSADQPAIGVAVSLIDTVRYPVWSALVEATYMTGNMLVMITVGISSLLIDAVTLSADLSQVAGPVGIVGMVGEAAEFGLASLLMFTAIISLNLAIINLLPVPALDGGRLLFVAIEAVIRRPLDPVWAGRANAIGFTILILLMLAVTFNDVLRII